MPSKYDQMESGDGLLVDGDRTVNLRCCDCGLVHRTTFEFVGPRSLVYRVYRNDRATSACRRYMKPVTFGTKNLKKEKGKPHAK